MLSLCTLGERARLKMDVLTPQVNSRRLGGQETTQEIPIWRITNILSASLSRLELTWEGPVIGSVLLWHFCAVLLSVSGIGTAQS